MNINEANWRDILKKFLGKGGSSTPSDIHNVKISAPPSSLGDVPDFEPYGSKSQTTPPQPTTPQPVLPQSTPRSVASQPTPRRKSPAKRQQRTSVSKNDLYNAIHNTPLGKHLSKSDIDKMIKKLMSKRTIPPHIKKALPAIQIARPTGPAKQLTYKSPKLLTYPPKQPDIDNLLSTQPELFPKSEVEPMAMQQPNLNLIVNPNPYKKTSQKKQYNIPDPDFDIPYEVPDIEPQQQLQQKSKRKPEPRKPGDYEKVPPRPYKIEKPTLKKTLYGFLIMDPTKPPFFTDPEKWHRRVWYGISGNRSRLYGGPDLTNFGYPFKRGIREPRYTGEWAKGMFG